MEAHSHGGSAMQANLGRLQVVLSLTASYMGIELAGGLISGSLALIADSGHVLVDAAGITIALIAAHFAAKDPTLDKSYGYYRLEILAAMVNGLLMVGIGAYILFEAMHRLEDPPTLPGLTVLAFAIPGFCINLASGVLLFEGQKGSLNIRGAFLEVVSDLAGSVAVIVTGIVIYVAEFKLIDPLASLAIGLFILPRTWKLMSEAIHVLLEGVPRGVNIIHIKEHIMGTNGVADVHDLHVWNLTSGMSVMSAHVVVHPGTEEQDVLDELRGCLEDHFDIEHSTFQIEVGDRRESEHAAH